MKRKGKRPKTIPASLKKRRHAASPSSLPTETNRRVRRHPLYGDIPLVPRTLTSPLGPTHVIYDYDPDYRPDLPAGAVRGDIRKQNLCFCFHVPKYFYVDETRTCVQCGQEFTFGASEQKFWYESLGFYGSSIAIRCVRCRRARRTEKTLRTQMAAASAGLKENPDDPALLLDLAEAICLYHERTGQGDLAKAIAAARRARKADPKAHEALYWEGFCHRRAGRFAKAIELWNSLVSQAPRSRKHRELSQRAVRELEIIAAPTPPGSSG